MATDSDCAAVNEITTPGQHQMNPAALAAALRGDIVNALIASTPGGIERQEADGQRTLVESAMLPKEINGATREQLTALGFKFGADVDELFVTCELPPGWKKSGTGHSMHSDLIDAQGRNRAGIFYKAAFYDRRADMTMCCRFRIEDYRKGPQEGHFNSVVTDGETVLFDAGEWKEDDYAQVEVMRDVCVQWLNSNHPEWQNPLAYWPQ
jgi:hypothetical protein